MHSSRHALDCSDFCSIDSEKFPFAWSGADVSGTAEALIENTHPHTPFLSMQYSHYQFNKNRNGLVLYVLMRSLLLIH